MTELSAQGALVAAEVAGIAGMRDDVTERAQALLESLRRLQPYDAALITLFDPEQAQHVPVVRRGYDNRVSRHLDSVEFSGELERVGLHRSSRVMRVIDLPFPPLSSHSWAEYLHPAGIREGFAIGLFTSDNRYLGVICLHTTDPRPPSEATCAFILRLVPLIADALDPMRAVAAAAGIVADATAAVVVTRAGTTMALPGLPGHTLLAPAAPVLTAAVARLAHDQVYATLLAPIDAPGAGPGFARVTALAVPARAPGHLRAVVLLSPPPPLRGLTHRELEVLGGLVEGWPSARIAAAMMVTERTIAAHIEHIMVKMGAASRTVAAVRAVRQGLYVPVELQRRRRTDA